MVTMRPEGFQVTLHVASCEGVDVLFLPSRYGLMRSFALCTPNVITVVLFS